MKRLIFIYNIESHSILLHITSIHALNVKNCSVLFQTLPLQSWQLYLITALRKFQKVSHNAHNIFSKEFCVKCSGTFVRHCKTYRKKYTKRIPKTPNLHLEPKKDEQPKEYRQLRKNGPSSKLIPSHSCGPIARSIFRSSPYASPAGFSAKNSLSQLANFPFENPHAFSQASTTFRKLIEFERASRYFGKSNSPVRVRGDVV